VRQAIFVGAISDRPFTNNQESKIIALPMRRDAMSRVKLLIVVAASFAAGIACQSWFVQSVGAQGTVTQLKHVDLGEWCPGKELTVATEQIGPQHQTRHYHNAYSFAWMIEGSQTRMVEGKPVESFKVGDVVVEAPREVSESEILTPTKVLLVRIAEKGKPLTVRIQ
jgi:hypothetical protein